MITNTQSELSKKLRMLRDRQHLTQAETAKKMNVSGKTIWDYENGRSTPPIDVILAFAKLYHVSTDYLLGNDNGEKGRFFLDVTGLTETERGIFEFLAKDLCDKNSELQNSGK